MIPEFVEFPKIARLLREVIVTEKIDGTNAQVYIGEDGTVLAGSRTRWITPEQDNFGFAAWVEANRADLSWLGPGRHYGEWWGRGIQRGYGLTEKRFSLFNVRRWGHGGTAESLRPTCCGVVPILWRGLFSTEDITRELALLRVNGSSAAPGFMDPEGVVVYHIAGNIALKKTIFKDEEPKSAAEHFLSLLAVGLPELEAAALNAERALDLLWVAVARARMEAHR